MLIILKLNSTQIKHFCEFDALSNSKGHPEFIFKNNAKFIFIVNYLPTHMYNLLTIQTEMNYWGSVVKLYLNVHGVQFIFKKGDVNKTEICCVYFYKLFFVTGSG